MGAIVGHILPKEFYRDINLFFQGMGQRAIDYVATIKGINNLLEHAVQDGKIIANNKIPQQLIEQAHDDLLDIIDDRIYCMMHLIKINQFIPHIINKHGSKFRHEDPNTSLQSYELGKWKDNVYCQFDFDRAAEVKAHNRNTKVNFWEINLPVYCEENSLWRDFAKLINDGYTHINSLRHLMTPETIRKREENIIRDPFCSNFLYGRETSVHDITSRAEYQYFSRTGFTLGLLKTSPTVAKWIAEKRRDSTHGKRMMDFLKTREHSVIFPAIWLRENRGASHGISDMIKRQFSREIPGIIPETGIFLGDVENKPPRNVKPRLVR